MALTKQQKAAQAAKQAAALKYGTESKSLTSLLQDTRDQFATGVRQETGIAEGIKSGLNQAGPAMQKTYANSASDARKYRAGMRQDFQQIGANAAPYAASAAGEYAGAQRRTSEERGAALRELAQRKTAANAGAKFAVTNLRNQSARDVAKIKARQAQLSSEQGTFTAKTYQDLLDQYTKQELDQQKLALDQSKAAEQGRHNRATEQISASKGSGSGSGAKGPTGTQRRDRLQTVEDARRAIRMAYAVLPSASSTDVRASKGVVKYPTWAVNAAFDLYTYKGKMSPANRQRLARELGGYRYVPYPVTKTTGTAKVPGFNIPYSR